MTDFVTGWFCTNRCDYGGAVIIPNELAYASRCSSLLLFHHHGRRDSVDMPSHAGIGQEGIADRNATSIEEVRGLVWYEHQAFRDRHSVYWRYWGTPGNRFQAERLPLCDHSRQQHRQRRLEPAGR
jgi:hypothetical protein